LILAVYHHVPSLLDQGGMEWYNRINNFLEFFLKGPFWYQNWSFYRKKTQFQKNYSNNLNGLKIIFVSDPNPK